MLPVRDAPERLTALRSVGHDLRRPECVLATADGSLYVSDWRGGVCHLRADGSQSLYLGTLPDGGELKPNGIALLEDGSFLLAQLGDTCGGVYRLYRDGRVTPWLTEVDGQPLPPTNFVVEDQERRFWVTVSTRLAPRALAYRSDVADGFVVLVDQRGARIVADGLGYTNEVAVHPNGRWLYVNETFARRLSRFEITADGSLGARELVAEFAPGTFPDGMAFDTAGSVWVVSIVSNRLIEVQEDGQQHVWLEDVAANHLDAVEAAYRAGSMGRPHLDAIQSQRLRNISSIAFSGPDRRTAVLGCLLGNSLESLTLPNPGWMPVHWNFPLPNAAVSVGT